ncbi:phosphotransferase family protein [Nocardia sp. alder85J]|uniref:phosphotransferase family protein n=1 Tax=Nocardia sp. alder85J TaxID=2862949 RepID=UPI001CD4C782|nr:phosphotransferase family protein [Nocardia sp. alder85J]MCX4099186.1 phosphotransferase family protein [Nocardia sp. alder85J]
MTLPGMDIDAVTRFLTERGVPLRGPLTAELISGGRSNLTFALTDGAARWVLRRPPTAGLTPSAHDMAREYTVTSALWGTAVPVAATVAADLEGTVLGAPFTVVEFVPGLVIRDRDDLVALTGEQIDACVHALVDRLVALHAVDYRAIGLETFGRPDGYVSRQVRLWARQWEQVQTRELPDAARLAAALADFAPPASASIVHGDYRIDNTILDAERPDVVRAVVDWEMSTLGDPLTDVALMCVYREPVFDRVLGVQAAWTSDRLPSADDLAQRYALASGRDLGSWPWYLALANFKIGVIAEGIAYRARQGADAGRDAVAAADATPEFMAAGLRLLRGDRAQATVTPNAKP